MALALTGSASGTSVYRPGRLAAYVSRRAWDVVRATPATSALVGALVATSALLSAGAVDADWLERWASTNIVNLHHHPFSAMIASAFVLTGPSVVNVGFTAYVCGVLERRVGSVRMLAVGLAGQVIASLLTEGAVRFAIRTGNESWSSAWRFDVGISYVMFTVAAAATLLAPVRLRRVLLFVGVAVTAGQLAAYHDMTSSGHAMSYVIGLLCWPLLSRDVAQLRVRRRALQALTALTIVGLLAIYLPLPPNSSHHRVRAASSAQVVSHLPSGAG
ncbi:MAG TPA: rhomboid-like protein [Jatrophihabitantaceae bacterium]|nr:rhomboid-like protein [Jatrophihabitantaceae bacterium]